MEKVEILKFWINNNIVRRIAIVLFYITAIGDIFAIIAIDYSVSGCHLQ